MRSWRSDFRELADEIREEDQPEAVAQLFEHVADLDRGREVQLESRPWLDDVKALNYDELILASVALTRVLDTAADLSRPRYMQPLNEIILTLEGEIARRKKQP